MALFRRTKSPRSVEFRTTAVAGLGNADKPGHQCEEHKRKEKKNSKSFSAHRRHKSDELNSIVELTEVVEPPTFLSQSEEVVDCQLSDPSPLYPPPQLPPRHRGGSGGAFNFSRSRPGWRRTQSGGTTMSSPQQHQQPPPHQEYFVPADTLKTVHRSSFLPSHNGAIAEHVQHGMSGSHHSSSSHSSNKDKRNIEMHNKIVAQNDPLLISSKRKSRSLENLVDCSDYSLPFDVVSERNEGSHQGGNGSSKSRSPEGSTLQVSSYHQSQKTHSDSNLSMHNTSTPPAKPARRTRDINPPSFAPPPPPPGETPPDLSPNSMNQRPKVDDYEEPWNSSKFLPRSSRRPRTETDTFSRSTHPHHISPSSDHKPLPKSHRSHTIHHETSPDSDQVPGVPPRINTSRGRTESADVVNSSHLPPSPKIDPHRPRTTTGESVGDYCIPPDAILHDFNGLGINGGSTGWSGVGRAGGEEHVRAYVNQPPVPPPTHRTVNSDIKQKHRYPPLVPSEYYITDIQSLPPPAFAIDTSLPLEEQPWFHGRISRDQAEEILYNQPDFSFLLRKSESSRMDYSLSIRDRTSPAAQGFIHLKITQEKGGYVLGQFSAPFHTVPLCISYYTQRELTIKHINHRRLGFPVGRMNNAQI